MDCDKELAYKVMTYGNFIRKRKMDKHLYIHRYVYGNTIYLISISDGEVIDVEIGEYE